MPVPTYQWKNLSIDFVIRLLVSTNWKGKSYDFILVIVNWLTKMVYYDVGKSHHQYSRASRGHPQRNNLAPWPA